MIFYFVIGKEAYTVERYLAERGAQWKGRLVPVYYETLPRMRSLPEGTCIFTDLDRLSIAQRQLVAGLYRTISAQRPNLTLLNDPSKFVGRFDLLRRLHEIGINDFNVFRPYEIGEDIQFPVFIRIERDHLGPRSSLIYTQDELDAALTTAIMAGVWPGNLMVIEFCDTSDSDGVFRKYSVTRMGNHYFARHQVIGTNWVLKVPTVSKGASWPASWLAEERRFLETNPHLAQVRTAFELANIEYGRIDYSVKDGRIQIWEINTNPQCMTPATEQLPVRLPFDEFIAGRFDEAWNNIDGKSSQGTPIKLALTHRMLDWEKVSDWAIG